MLFIALYKENEWITKYLFWKCVYKANIQHTWWCDFVACFVSLIRNWISEYMHAPGFISYLMLQFCEWIERSPWNFQLCGDLSSMWSSIRNRFNIKANNFPIRFRLHCISFPNIDRIILLFFYLPFFSSS